MFVTSEGHPYAVLQRSLANGNLWVAETVARDLPRVPLEDALKLTHLYAEKEQWDKFERAAMKWLRRYWTKRSPRSRTSRRSCGASRIAWKARCPSSARRRELLGPCFLGVPRPLGSVRMLVSRSNSGAAALEPV